ncbi:dihydropteroate synthase [Nesterenkonia xinjiangensis]|uniref:Dihydropteroate synthase n=1 Tax=Nesterenkonia xinjiangensis TaxID=225327 RepID=A0A7Z0GN63_9MICC|nr:dihydropteroate synthase [Nesterenkonia xinjiangensis]NYJ78181.1 dihydropteroate synthase [Nesterenkonia xinjiangensis]
MDTMGAAPGTGPNTGPMSVVRRIPRKKTVGDLPTDRTLVMGVLNVTPDSFSDGGRFLARAGTAVDHESAVHAGLSLHYAGADIIDVGGESTRPGAQPVDEQEEQRRILPVLEALFTGGAVVSVDTRHPGTAAAAIERAPGPEHLLINDVSGLMTAEHMPQVVAEGGVRVIVTHNRGDAQTMQSRTDYVDVVAEVIGELEQIRDRYRQAGVPAERIILDPGIGFAKTAEQNWELLRHLDRVVSLGHPVLLGVSRKGFLGELLAASEGPREPEGRDAATLALSTLAAQAGAWAVRVHDVGPTLDAMKAVAEIQSR